MKYAFKLLLAIFICYSPLKSFPYEYELVVATMFHNEADYLKEWIEYHLAAGVDHFWMYNDRSTDNWKEIFQPYIEKGIIEVFDWPIRYDLQKDYTGTQVEAFKDAIIRGKGKTKWLTFIDIDEFVLPMKEATITKCLNKYFKNAHAVYANWRCFGSGGVYVPKGDPLLFKLTASSLQHHARNCVGKTILRPEFVDTNLVWYNHTCPLKKGGIYLNGSAEPIPPAKGINIETDGKNHSKFIRINHYVMRDEDFYQNIRLYRAIHGYKEGYRLADPQLIAEHNRDFSIVKDYAIINFIKKYHFEAYERIWK